MLFAQECPNLCMQLYWYDLYHQYNIYTVWLDMTFSSYHSEHLYNTTGALCLCNQAAPFSSYSWESMWNIPKKKKTPLTPLGCYCQCKTKKGYEVKIRTSSTSFSRKGTSFRSSLSFLSTNQLSIGIPLESLKTKCVLY